MQARWSDSDGRFAVPIRALAGEMLRLGEAEIDAMRANGTISEVICDG